MRWSQVQQDWSGFMTLLGQMLPTADVRDGAAFPTDLDGFRAALARATDLTVAEASDLLATRILPVWKVRRTALAA